MSRIRETICAIATLTVMYAPAVAQTPAQRVDAALERAQEAGVPVELLESKIAEGRAKGIPMERIAQAVENRLAVLQGVRERIGERWEFSGSELGVAADAAQSGVSEEVLESIAANAPRDRRAVAIAALTQLVQLGERDEDALQRVMEALDRGPEALMELPAQAAEAAARRGPPDQLPGQGPPDGATAQGRGGPPTGVPPAGSRGRGRGRGGG